MTGEAKAAKEETEAEGGSENLINDVIEKVSAIYKKNESVSYYETGELILAEIYEIENPEKYEWKLEDLKKKKDKSKVFNKLKATMVSKLKEGADLPKKTFLYNAFNLVKEKQAMLGNEQYDSLSMVNRIALLSVKKAELKEQLVKEIADKKLTSRQTKELIVESKGKGKEKSPFLEYINNPQEKELPSDSDIGNLSEEEKKAFADRANKRIADIAQKIEDQEKRKQLLDEFVAKLMKAEVEVIEEKKETEETAEV